MNTFCRRARAVVSLSARRAFTLLEVMVVVGLLGLLATVLSIGGARLLSDRAQSPVEVFWTSVREARKFALLHECEVWLVFDNEARVFRAETEIGAQEFTVPPEPKFSLDFLSTAKGAHSILLGGTVVENSPIPGVRFFEDGTCMPFRAQLRVEGQMPVVVDVDPWTCAAVLRTEGTR